jgi:hypothetical protein
MTLVGGAILVIEGYVQRPSFEACRTIVRGSRHRATTTPRRPGREATGMVIGNSPYEYRLRVQCDDTGEVTHSLKRNLEPAR